MHKAHHAAFLAERNQRVSHYTGLSASTCLCLRPWDCLCQCVCARTRLRVSARVCAIACVCSESVCVCLRQVCVGAVFPFMSTFACMCPWGNLHSHLTGQRPYLRKEIKKERRRRVSPGLQRKWRVWAGAVVGRKPRLTKSNRDMQGRTWGGYAAWTRDRSRASRGETRKTDGRGLLGPEKGGALLISCKSMLLSTCWNTKIHTRFTTLYNTMTFKIYKRKCVEPKQIVWTATGSPEKWASNFHTSPAIRSL